MTTQSTRILEVGADYVVAELTVTAHVRLDMEGGREGHLSVIDGPPGLLGALEPSNGDIDLFDDLRSLTPTAWQLRTPTAITHHPCPVCGIDTRESEGGLDVFAGLWSVCAECAQHWRPDLYATAAQSWRDPLARIVDGPDGPILLTRVPGALTPAIEEQTWAGYRSGLQP
jgi:hypothetical protein